ncbi:MAG: D-2-hydroxyacid dehydrogenase [Oscillospiraceae bacterium]|nr:D-2-hydroxyacid dehydrogenase [Oscillospiraceae bacterium]
MAEIRSARTLPKMILIPGIAVELSPSQLLRIKEILPRAEIHYTGNMRAIADIMPGAEVIFGHPDPKLLKAADKLQWLHLPFSGIDVYGDIRLYANRSVTLTNARGIYGITVSEHILGMVLALLRGLPDYVRQQDRRIWERKEHARELYGSVVLVLGLGDLGKRTAALFKAMGCSVWGIRRNSLQTIPEVDNIYPLHKLHSILPEVDIVINCLPETTQTLGLFDSGAFGCMSEQAIFVNAGRGGAVDEEALCRALSEKKIFAAAIDVSNQEPPGEDSLLWQTPGLLISPHSAAASPYVFRRNYELFCDLLSRYASGRRLYNKVDFFAGY